MAEPTKNNFGKPKMYSKTKKTIRVRQFFIVVLSVHEYIEAYEVRQQ